MKEEIITLRLTNENEDYLNKIIEKKNATLSSMHLKTSPSEIIREIINWSYTNTLDNPTKDKLETILNNKTKKVLDILILKQQTLNTNLIIMDKLLEYKFGEIDVKNYHSSTSILEKIEEEMEEYE